MRWDSRAVEVNLSMRPQAAKQSALEECNSTFRLKAEKSSWLVGGV